MKNRKPTSYKPAKILTPEQLNARIYGAAAGGALGYGSAMGLSKLRGKGFLGYPITTLGAGIGGTIAGGTLATRLYDRMQRKKKKR